MYPDGSTGRIGSRKGYWTGSHQKEKDSVRVKRVDLVRGQDPTQDGKGTIFGGRKNEGKRPRTLRERTFFRLRDLGINLVPSSSSIVHFLQDRPVGRH